MRWRRLLPAGMCGLLALLVMPATGVAVVGAALTLLGIAVFTWRHRPIGAAIASAGLGVLVPSAVPTLLHLLDSM